MAANDPDSRSTPPKDGGELAIPRYPAGPPSIISSRMTDIASEDGDEFGDEQIKQSSANPQRRSGMASDSRPGTAKTGFSSSRGGQPHRIGLHRVSLNNSISGSVTTGRPPSAASKSHVPSLTSHAFFHPMSSQKLQAQRGASRSSGFHQTHGSLSENTTDNRVHIPQQRTSMPGAPLSPVSPLVRQNSADGPLPPSRGTEMTEPEPFDRVTATTSPTQGHYPAGSLTDSVRPLQQRNTAEKKGLSLDVDKSNAFGNAGNLPTPSRTPRSFRSSFLLPSRGEPSGNANHRNMPGAEKLSSGASSPQLSAIDTAERAKRTEPAKPQKPKLGRNYEYFEGNTVFAVGGRLQNTRHRPISIATALAVVIPAILFLVYSAPFYWYRVSPAVPIVFAYLFYLSISSFLHASSSDPGVSTRPVTGSSAYVTDNSIQILPRNLHRFPPAADNEDPLRLAPPMNDWTLIKSAESSTAAMEVPTKYCKTCSLWRPPRAHHCRLCDNCVETQDHHCVWLNNCVGRRNYRYFFTFVTATTLLGFYLVGASLAHVLLYASQEGISVGASIDQFRVPFAMFVYGLIATIYPAALMGYHLFLMARGETTREFLNSHKFLKKDRYRAFTQGSTWKNWVTVLCRPRPPTYYRFKNRFEEGDQRFGERRDRRQTKTPGNGQDVELQNVPPLSSSGFQGPTALRNAAQTSQA